MSAIAAIDLPVEELPVKPVQEERREAPALMEWLKAETRRAHEEAEEVEFHRALMAKRLPLNAYIGQLRAYERLFGNLYEAVLGAGDRRLERNWSPGPKAGELFEDLLFLDPEQQVRFPETMKVAGELVRRFYARAESASWSLLGSLYVLEGSTLGGMVLRRHLLANFPFLTQEGLRFYGSDPRGTVLRWKSFQKAMNEEEFSLTERGELLEAARETFQGVGLILRILGEESSLCVPGRKKKEGEEKKERAKK